MHHCDAVARVEVQKSLRIGGCPEVRAGGLEFGAQRTIIIYLTIEGDRRVAVGAQHRLRSTVGQIEY
jgi:hypothetical protein